LIKERVLREIREVEVLGALERGVKMHVELSLRHIELLSEFLHLHRVLVQALLALGEGGLQEVEIAL
jgi:hypothetical protein